jgi:hypothetical protein
MAIGGRWWGGRLQAAAASFPKKRPFITFLSILLLQDDYYDDKGGTSWLLRLSLYTRVYATRSVYVKKCGGDPLLCAKHKRSHTHHAITVDPSARAQQSLVDERSTACALQ